MVCSVVAAIDESSCLIAFLRLGDLLAFRDGDFLPGAGDLLMERFFGVSLFDWRPREGDFDKARLTSASSEDWGELLEAFEVP